MTAIAWSTRARHDSDAYFREWGSEFNAKLAAVGLVQTSDTGQINWVTVNRAGTTTDAGYEIWRFDDTMQGTAPIYMRFNYGTYFSASSARITFHYGTGSNGSGTLTNPGTASVINLAGGSSTDTPWTSYICCVDGAFWIGWKDSTYYGFCFITRTCDNDGVPTAVGAMSVTGSSYSTINTQAMRFASPLTVFVSKNSYSAQLGFMPQGQLSSANSAGVTQVAVGWMWTPDVQPIFSAVGVREPTIANSMVFSCTPVGTTPRTYIAINREFCSFDAANLLKFGLIWE